MPRGIRPAVALPLNSRLAEGRVSFREAEHSEYWEKNEWFTMRGLPSIKATPGSWDEANELWGMPDAAAFIELMRTPHPKIVLLGRQLTDFASTSVLLTVHGEGWT